MIQRSEFMGEKEKIQIRNSTVDFLVFTKQNSEDGIDVRIQDDSVWLTKKDFHNFLVREEPQ